MFKAKPKDKKMNKDEFISACHASWGEHFVKPASEALGVSDRAVRYWVSGKYAIPESIRDPLINILESRAINLNQVIAALNYGRLPMNTTETTQNASSATNKDLRKR